MWKTARPRRRRGRRSKVYSAVECNWACVMASVIATCSQMDLIMRVGLQLHTDSHAKFLFVTCLILPSSPFHFRLLFFFFLSLRFLLDSPYTTLTMTRIRKPHLARVDRREKEANETLEPVLFGCFFLFCPLVFFPFLLLNFTN